MFRNRLYSLTLNQLFYDLLMIMFVYFAEIEKVLNDIGKSLKDFPTLPFPPDKYLDLNLNRLLLQERSYDVDEMRIEFQKLESKLNEEQRRVYQSVIDAVNNNLGGLFFVKGSGGCGKTYLWKTIIAWLRSQSKIVLPVASSGIAATLLPGGRTAHSRFKIPLKLDESSMCSIRHGSDIAELLKETSLIIWDEAPMQNRVAFECLDRSLRDIMKSVNVERAKKPFGGIPVLLGGDFRQILPVINRGSRSDIVSASICRSYLWSSCEVHNLSRNMRLYVGNSEDEKRGIQTFSEWVLDIGDGKVQHIDNDKSNSEFAIQIPSRYVIYSNPSNLSDLIECIYPNLATSYLDIKYIRERAILTPKNTVVDHLNRLILDNIPGDVIEYASSDYLDLSDGPDQNLTSAFPVEYLNSIKLPGMPPHQLVLKVGVVVMLLRNMNQCVGLCNGTRMVVRKCLKHSIVCEIISGSFEGSQHVIPRIEICPSDTILPFNLIRLQFPVQLCFVMTINKSQGQSLDRVGLYLPEPAFCHGQLYVAVSRVTSPKGLFIYIENPDGSTTDVTDNVVYEEIFYTLRQEDEVQ